MNPPIASYEVYVNVCTRLNQYFINDSVRLEDYMIKGYILNRIKPAYEHDLMSFQKKDRVPLTSNGLKSYVRKKNDQSVRALNYTRGY